MDDMSALVVTISCSYFIICLSGIVLLKAGSTQTTIPKNLGPGVKHKYNDMRPCVVSDCDVK